MKRITFTSESAPRCQLIYGDSPLDKLPKALKILDSGARKVFGTEMKAEHLMVGGEHVKSIDRVFEIYQLIRASGWKSVMAIGGGSILDVVGFAASTHREIEKLYLLPTSVIGQIMPPLSGFYINFEFVKNLLHSGGLASKVYVNGDLSYDTLRSSSGSELLFPLLVALSLDTRLFRYINNHVLSGGPITKEVWSDIVYSASATYVKGVGDCKTVIGAKMADLIQTVSRLRTDYSLALIYGAVIELSLEKRYGMLSEREEVDFLKAVKLLWKGEWLPRLDMSSLTDLINQKSGLRVTLPASYKDSSRFLTSSDFERYVRERPWRGLESFA